MDCSGLVSALMQLGSVTLLDALEVLEALAALEPLDVLDALEVPDAVELPVPLELPELPALVESAPSPPPPQAVRASSARHSKLVRPRARFV
ncbi:hypothetical protein ABDB87_00470 [Uliginosibacterium paludis]|uniref:hypothetical protein n=1 Tax=Uliginosibacterium paludis TaxID=1615952 RepID=UPI0031F70E29